MNTSKAPTQINDNEIVITSPELMANAFNRIFVDKVRKIREKASEIVANIDPIQRMRSWLNKRPAPLPNFDSLR